MLVLCREIEQILEKFYCFSYNCPVGLYVLELGYLPMNRVLGSSANCIS